MTNLLPKSRQSGLVTQELKNEILIYNLTTHKAHCLNGSMAHIWHSCDGKTTFQQVIDSFEDHHQTKINEDFVWLAIDELAKADLIETRSLRFKDQISRRNALLKIGLPLAMLPIITAVIAPTAAHAASGFCNPGDPDYCVTHADCLNGNACNATTQCCGPSGGGGQSGGGDDCTFDCG